MGKTQAIVSWLMEDPQWRGVIVGDKNRQDHLLARIRRTPLARLGKKYWEDRIITAARFPMALRGYGFREVALEDFEYLFEAMYGIKVGFMVATGTVIAPDMPDVDIIDGEEVWEDGPPLEIAPRRSIFDMNLNPAGPDRFA